MTRFDPRDLDNAPLNDIELAILGIETLAGDDKMQRRRMVEEQLGWTTAYYNENVMCLASDPRVAEVAPGLAEVLKHRYPPMPARTVWPDDEAFTRSDHV